MYTILDYLVFRGDIGLDVDGFNEIDNLLLSQVAYVDLRNIVPSDNQTITLQEAARVFFKQHTMEELNAVKALTKACPFTFEKMANAKRYGNIQLSNYVDYVDDEKCIQFSAMHMKLSDGTTYISFRGTDDTLVGWREDFEMLYKYPMEGQKRAVAYLNETVKLGFRPLRIGGHSKGGNLAVYAAAMCKPSIQRRITQVYNNDGPGFWKEFVKTEGYQKILPRIITLVPEDSFFGMLLEHEEEFRIVHSKDHGLMQHDVLNWYVRGNTLQYAMNFNEEAIHMHEAIVKWFEAHKEEDREKAVVALFKLIDASGAKNLSELMSLNIKNMNELIKILIEFDSDTRNLLLSIFGLIAGEYNRSMISYIRKMVEKI